MTHSKFLILFISFITFFYSCKDEVEPTINYSTPAVEDIVMYEINIRCFSNTADFQGIIARLDSIQALGINTIWLMPIHPVGQLNSVGGLGSPYSVQNYTEVNSEFGSLVDFENLVIECHNRNIAVILDWVANHTAWDNPWIANTDWYTQDGSGNIISPLGTGWNDVADLNFSNDDMRVAMIDAMEYWVNETDIDGFRCDAADMVPFDFWADANLALRGIKSDIIMLAEGARDDHFTAGFDMNYAWDFYSTLKNVFINNYSATAIFTTHFSEMSGIPEGKFKLRFTTNHDETAWDEPPVSLFNGIDGALAASVITMYLNGIPLFYNGQEVGCAVNLPLFSATPINWTLNADMQNTYQKLISFYKDYSSLKMGDITQYNNAFILAFKKTFENEESLIIVNVKNINKDFPIPAELNGSTWTDLMSGSQITLDTNMNLLPYEFKILKRNI